MKDEVVEFKSTLNNYLKELSGLKPNTIRRLPIGDEREEILRRWEIVGDCGQIKIRNSLTKEYFTRNVSDVTIWEDIIIISWRHKE
jgi:hypothetical protein